MSKDGRVPAGESGTSGELANEPASTVDPASPIPAPDDRAALRQTIDTLGRIGSEREAGWQRLFGKLLGRIGRLEKRIAKRDGRLSEQQQSIALLEHRVEKLRRRLADAEAESRRLSSELEARLPPARIRLRIGRNALIAFDDTQAAAPVEETMPTDAEQKADDNRAITEQPATDASAADASTAGVAETEDISADWLEREARRLLPAPAIGQSTAGVGRVVFFGAVAGDYDIVADPAVFDVRADYILFTDQPGPEGIWRPRPFDFHSPDKTRMARYVKLHPHRYFGGYDYAIWVDANLTLAATAEALISSAGDADIVAWHHPLRDCVYDEAEECLTLGKDDPAVIATHVSRLREQGYPEHAGLIESSVLLTRPQRPHVAAFMDDWWRAVANGSRRDQLSFNPTLREHAEIQLGYFAEPGINPKTDPRFFYRHHRGPGAKAHEA